MTYSLGISHFLEEISSVSHSIVFLYFFAMITGEGFLISPCYSLELCIQMGISFLFSFAFHFSSELFVRPPQTTILLLCIFFFSWEWSWSLPPLQCLVMSMCRVYSCVIERWCLLWPVCSLGKTVLAFALLHSVLQGQICLWLQVFPDFLLLHSSPVSWKGRLFWLLVLEGLVGIHRTIKFQLLQHYWLGNRLGFLCYWTVCLGNEWSFCHFWDCTKSQFSFQSQRKVMPKNVQTTAQLHSSHTLVK